MFGMFLLETMLLVATQLWINKLAVMLNQTRFHVQILALAMKSIQSQW